MHWKCTVLVVIGYSGRKATYSNIHHPALAYRCSQAHSYFTLVVIHVALLVGIVLQLNLNSWLAKLEFKSGIWY